MITHFVIALDPKRTADQSPLIEKFSVRFEFKRCRVRLSNLFGGDPVLGNTINQAINQNIDMFVGPLMPLINARMGEEIMPLINKFLSHFSNAQLFAE